MAEKDNKTEKKTVGEKVAAFLIKYRVLFLSIIGICIVAAIVVGVVLTVSESYRKKALTDLDGILQPVVNASETDLTSVQDTAIPELLALAERNKSNIAGVRAYMALAEIYFNREQWADAMDAWVRAAAIDEKAYTAAVCYYNAAVCSEELGDVETAVLYYEKVLVNKECLFVPHVLFSLGRLAEESGDYASAGERYSTLVDTYSSDSWASLAKSRLIELSVEGKIQ